MRRTTLVGLLAVPLCIAGLGWLMLHGHLELAVWLLLAAVVGMVVASVWEWRHGHRRWGALLLTGALLTTGTVGGYAWDLNSKLDQIGRVPDDVLGKGQRPDAGPTRALNILLMGADNPDQLEEKPTVAQLLADGHWDAGAYRSDSLMVVHIPADRKTAYVVSIPRDSYVPIYDAEGGQHGENKINEAFSRYGPFGTWRTVEHLTGLRLDHMAIIDYKGFRDLTTAVGGVDVYVPQTVYDEKLDQTWTQGWHHLEGNLALKYVRQRHGLANSDFDRVNRQQNFLRALMQKVLADGTIGNPIRFSSTLDAITRNLTVDASWTSSEIRGLALDLRGVRADRIRFVTVPLDHFETVAGVGSVNIIAAERSRELWADVAADTLGRYLEKYPKDELADPRDVS